jgi:hypothetical protein
MCTTVKLVLLEIQTRVIRLCAFGKKKDKCELNYKVDKAYT